MYGSRLSIRWASTATYAVPASKCDGSIFDTTPQAGSAATFFVTSLHLAPPARGPGPRVVPRNLVAVARRPDDVGIRGIGNGEARLAAAEAVLPRVAEPVEAGARAFGRPRRAAHRAIVLHVAVHEVRHLRVDRHVIHLPDRQRDALNAAAVLLCDAETRIVRDHEALRVLRIPPDVVVVAAPVDPLLERAPAVGGLPERAVRDEHFVLVHGRNGKMDVIAGAADQRALPVDDAPRTAAVVRAPQRSLVRRLDQRIDATGIVRRDRDVNLSKRRSRQPFDSPLILTPPAKGLAQGRSQSHPRRTAVGGLVHAAAWSSAQLGPWMHLHLPRTREQRPRIFRVHRQTRAAGVLVDEQHAVPVLTAVGGAEYAALCLPACHAADRARDDDAGIGGVNADAADAARLVEGPVRPGRASVERLINTVADDVAVADRPRLSSTRPDDARVGRRDGKRADGRDGQGVRHRRPSHAAVGRLPYAAGCGAGAVREWIARHAGDRGDAVADGRPDEAECQTVRGRAAAAALGERYGYAERRNRENGQNSLHVTANFFHSRGVPPLFIAAGTHPRRCCSAHMRLATAQGCHAYLEQNVASSDY